MLAAYEEAAADGADAVLSVHIGSEQSATIASARVAAGLVDLPVTIVDTRTTSFIAGCCVWRAGEVLAAGGTVGSAGAAAEEVAGQVASVFTIGEVARARAGGRLAVGEGAGVPVFTSAGPEMSELARVTTIDEGVAAMTERVGRASGPLRIGVGDADAPEAAAALHQALTALPQAAEVVRYAVGPSVAIHTGAGTFGAVYHPIDPGDR